MKNKYIITILIILISIFVIPTYQAADIDMYKPGFKLWGYDINLMSLKIHNGTITGTNFMVCNNLTQASVWNSSYGLECNGNFALNSSLANYLLTATYSTNYPNNNITAANISLWSNQSNATVDAQIAALQSSDTNTCLLSGGCNITGTHDFVNANYSGALYGSKSRGRYATLAFNDLLSVANRSLAFFGTNRVFNQTAQKWEMPDGYVNQYGIAFTMDGGNVLGTVPARLRLQFFINASDPGELWDNYSFSKAYFNLSNVDIVTNKLAGTGTSIAQLDSTGKLVTNRSNGAGIPVRTTSGFLACIYVSDTYVVSASNGTC